MVHDTRVSAAQPLPGRRRDDRLEVTARPQQFTGTRRACRRLARLACALSAIALLASPTLSLAEPPGPHPGPGPGEHPGPGPHAGPDGRDHSGAGFIERHAERLGLEPEMLEQIQGIVRASGERDAALDREMGGAREEMNRLLSQPEPPQAAVLANAEKIGALLTEARKNRLLAILQIRSMLTPEQRDELVRIRAERRPEGRGPGRRGRRGMGMGRRFHHSCREDFERACPDQREGRELLRCMERQWDQLSGRCRAAFEQR